MFALIGNFDFTELIVVAAVSLMLFGKRLPEVAMRGASHFMRLRRSVSKMWREAGLEDELRRIRRDVEVNVPKFKPPHHAVKEATRKYMRDLEKDVDNAGEDDKPVKFVNPALEKARAHKSKAEQEVKPSEVLEESSTTKPSTPDYAPRPLPKGALGSGDQSDSVTPSPQAEREVEQAPTENQGDASHGKQSKTSGDDLAV